MSQIIFLSQFSQYFFFVLFNATTETDTSSTTSQNKNIQTEEEAKSQVASVDYITDGLAFVRISRTSEDFDISVVFLVLIMRHIGQEV